jgi:hypothetical protein
MMARTAVVAGTATAVSNRVSRRQAGRWSELAEPEYLLQPAGAAPPPAAEAAEPDYMAELQDLAKLRDSGVITPDEFEAKKKQILGI